MSLFLFEIPWRSLRVVITSIVFSLLLVLFFFIVFLSLPHVFFSEELNDSLNEDVPGETREPTSCNASEHKDTKPEGASSSSSGE